MQKIKHGFAFVSKKPAVSFGGGNKCVYYNFRQLYWIMPANRLTVEDSVSYAGKFGIVRHDKSLSKLCEFSVEFFRRLAVSGVSFFGGIERSEIVPVSVHFNARDVLIAFFHKTYALVARGVVFLRAAVSMVFRRSNVSKIAPSVVSLVFVFVVYFVFGPFARDVQPSQSMGHVLVALDSNFDSPFAVLKSRYCPNHIAAGQGDSPSKESSVSIVMQDRTQKFRSQILQRIFASAFHVQTLAPGEVIVKRFA